MKKERFDLVFMDLHMPNMDGITATKMIRKREQGTDQHIPIIAMTAAAMQEDQDECLASGMDVYIAKPVKSRELFETIANVVKSHIQPFVSVFIAPARTKPMLMSARLKLWSPSVAVSVMRPPVA